MMSAIFKLLTLLIITASLARNSVDAQSNLPNIKFLGQGYDVIEGNPHSLGTDAVDPGFRQPVLMIEYKQSIRDGKWFVPDNVEVRDTQLCSLETTSQEIKGTKSYQEQLSVDAKIEGDVLSLYKFSVSSGYQQVKEETSSYRSVFVSSVAKCTSYEAYVSQLAPYSSLDTGFIRVTPLFARAVKDLPLNANDRKYIQFISTFGTHYITRVMMGAKAVIMSTFDQTTWTTLKSTGFNFKASASASFIASSVSASVLTEQQKQQSKTFDESRTDKKEFYLGSRPPADGKLETWAMTSGIAPLPISYKLYPLTNLFTTDYLPEIDAVSLAEKQMALLAAFEIYCRGLPGCGAPTTPVPIPIIQVKLDQSTNIIVGVQTVSCRPGYKLLSCGYGNYEIKKGRFEQFRRSIPISSTTCECYASFGARCYAWCTNVVRGFHIANSGLRTGTSSVFCPSESKLLGCHSNSPPGKRIFEWSPAWKPTSNGNGCTCYDRLGTTCIASCATNILNHEVKSSYGKGNTVVRCSPGNVVLGCGFEAVKLGFLSAVHGEYRVDSSTSCYCNSYLGATCYAICGKIISLPD